MKKFSDQKIIDSWSKNAHPWMTAVHEGEIKSRLLITNKAIINTVLARNPKTVLDVGCGEGWIIRELNKAGIKSLGIDVVPELIEYANKQGNGRFKILSYQELSSEVIKEKFDLIVCNFSLLGYESVNHVFKQAPSLLNNGGSMIIQTIHPVTECGDEDYKDGWREGSWKGFNRQFSDPAPWYFRTLETWKVLFLKNGFELIDMIEPINPETNTPASIVFVGTINKHTNFSD